MSNVTDIDDNIIKRAAEHGRTEPDVAAEFEARWWEAMDALGVLRPHDIPHATAYIEDMVALVGDLWPRSKAYETSDGVYLEVSKVEGYGLLAQQSLESLQVGRPGRGERGQALAPRLRPVEEGQGGRAGWDSPWGPGRPGWHTECVVMSLDLLGEGFDLHGGGQDLKFPHHENERAQAVADGKVFAQHWVHNGWVVVEGTKMSKSLGNFTTLPDLLSRDDARAYRLLVLRAHYRSPIEVTPDTLADAEKALARLDGLARRFPVADLLERHRARVRRRWDAARDRLWTRWRRPPSGRAWTTTSTPRVRWPASSSWSRRRTPPPTPATRKRALASLARPRCWPRRSGSRCGPRTPLSTRSRRGWWPNATRPGRPGLRPCRRPARRAGGPGLDGRGHPVGHRHPPLTDSRIPDQRPFPARPPDAWNGDRLVGYCGVTPERTGPPAHAGMAKEGARCPISRSS